MKTVTLNHVTEALSGWTGIPANRLGPGAMNLGDPEELRAKLRKAIIGQDEAVDIAVRAISRRARLGHRPHERRPLWTALFTGPSGVGKTQLAKELCRGLVGDADRHLVQIDLAGFRDEHTIARLVGAPPGYKGHGDGGELTNALRRVTSGVILLDEIEKAHPAVLTQVLLPLLGEATVHDMNDGRRLDASQFIVVMTSNLGGGEGMARAVGFEDAKPEAHRRRFREGVERYLPREVVGRIETIVVMDSLSMAAIRGIWDRELRALEAHLAHGPDHVRVAIAPEATELLLSGIAKESGEQGARAVKRLLDRALTERCLELLEGHTGSALLRVTHTRDGGLRFQLETHPEPVSEVAPRPRMNLPPQVSGGSMEKRSVTQ